ncbi:MAG: sigma-70 family RNA polymerase sigma factor [Planctomycetota bacterium]|nr:sigma-70 family RNA polymerase sigma factor [Planctomycetota bacterium]
MDPISVTQLLQRIDDGEEAAREQLAGEVYGELHRMACRYLSQERVDHTLQPTALVSELYLGLFRENTPLKLKDRNHLLTTAARAMRRLLIDHARSKNSAKRGGGADRVDLDHIMDFYEERGVEMLELDEALTRLSAMDPNLAQVVELRFFAGRTNAQTAEIMGLSERSIERAWSTARAWLRNQLSADSGESPGGSQFS